MALIHTTTRLQLSMALSSVAKGSRPVRILVVDDDPTMREMIAGYLAEHNMIAIPATGRSQERRRWPDDVKARIVMESLVPGTVVTQLAQLHGCRGQQVHDLRRLARTGRWEPSAFDILM